MTTPFCARRSGIAGMNREPGMPALPVRLAPSAAVVVPGTGAGSGPGMAFGLLSSHRSNRWPGSHPLQLPALLAALLLGGCQSTEKEPAAPVPAVPVPEAVAQVEQQSEEQLRALEIEFRRQRLIGDLLYDALRAMQQDRLLLPADDNAYSRYQRVLTLEPDNQLALEGLKSIVDRYLELAATASRQGRFAAAAGYIERARYVDRNDPAIATAREALERDRNSGDLVFELDTQELAARSEGLQQQLAGIAEQAVLHQAFVWITAPNDEQGRWIYSVMREHADGYRLRGNIELGGFVIIRLRLPAAARQETASRQEPGQAHSQAGR